MSDEKNWLEKISNWFERIPENQRELVELLREINREGVLDTHALTMIEGALQVSQLTVAEIMVPRAQMVSIGLSQTPEEFIPEIRASGHSRFPVFDVQHEQVVGILLAKDLLQLVLDQEAKADFQFDEYLRPAMIVPESKHLDGLLQEFKRARQHLAMVVDEYGVVVGLVTIEDVLEQIVGEIDDEYDVEDEEQYVKVQDDGTSMVKANMPLTEFNEYFSTHYDDANVSTIGGFLLNQWHRLPHRNENLQCDECHFTVLKADHRRIQLLSVKKL